MVGLEEKEPRGKKHHESSAAGARPKGEALNLNQGGGGGVGRRGCMERCGGGVVVCLHA